MTPAQVLEKLARRLNDRPDRLGLEDATFQLVVTGPQGGTWVLSVVGGTARLSEGPVPEADLTVEVSDADFQALVEGRLAPAAAFVSGRLRVRGDLGLALRLQPLLG